MKKKIKLVNKVKRLIRKAGLPRWLHHYGPKKYEFWQHAVALLIKQECKLSYRRVSNLLNSLGFVIPTYSALAKMVSRLPISLWQRLLKATIGFKVNIGAIDSTGLSRTKPSTYYIKRIDKPFPIQTPFKLSLIADTRKKKVLAVRFRAKQCHDIRDAKYLLRRYPNINKLVGDGAYDAEHLYEFAWDNKIITIIPKRKGSFRGFYRKKMQRYFRKRTYNRRSMVESVFFMLKRKFGDSLSSRRFHNQNSEIYCRAIIHNLFLKIMRIFNMTFFYPKTYILVY